MTHVYRFLTLIDMAKTRKIQVTLEESQYAALARIAERDEKKLAAVVRESIVRYCLEPESKKAKREALKALLAMSAAAPEDYASWEREYVSLKSETGEPETRDSKARGRKGR